jgi:hypothetical protein
MVKNVTTLVRSLATLGLLIGACAAPVAAPSHIPASPAVPSATIVVEPSPAPSPTGVPGPTQGPRAEVPEILMDPRPIPIVASLVLQAPQIGAEIEKTLRERVEFYLWYLDLSREGKQSVTDLPISGRFAEVVKAGLESTARPGVKRKFSLESMSVERYLVKPWGTPALAEVSVTIIDRAVEGTAPEERETGKLRLTGDRLSVTDGWDLKTRTWFNGMSAMTEDEIRRGVPEQLKSYLSHESWIPGQAKETRFSSTESPFIDARHAFVASFDRTKIPSRTFAELTAQVERYETFREVSHGLATVRLSGTVLTKDGSGAGAREPFERRVVVLFGNWAPEIVDEETSPGVWLSGGDQALKDIDLNRA